MPRRLIAVAVGVLLSGAAAVGACSGDDDPAVDAAGSGLATRTVSAGEVDVTIEPDRIDADGAVFTITLDTHSVELSADLTRATLVVGGRDWPVEGWSGDGPGGHHRSGELRFTSGGPASGTVVLTVPDLPEPAEAAWELDG